ncbi:MAG: response regulator [Bdellovibrionaceae bacterium]|nr:response regulator [Pseudobdellovibrionaceae bacterium]
MAKKLKVLLVEDDKRFGQSLKVLLEKEGFECLHAEKPQTALELCKLHTFDAAVIDCMLPQMNGVDLAIKIKENFGSHLTIFMMSGIYKDRNFTISALKKTGAKSFLIKPFDIGEFISQLQEIGGDTGTEPVLSENPLKNFLLQENITQNTVYSTIEKISEINGQELPLIFNFLLATRGQGALTLLNGDAEISIHFNENNISLPITKLQGDKLKNILTAKDYVMSDDLNRISPAELNLQNLIVQNFLSPHFSAIIQKDNSLQYLNSFVVNQSLKIHFKPGRTTPFNIVIDQKEIDDILYGWIHLTDCTWIKTYYLPYMQNILQKMNTTQNKTHLFPLVMGNQKIVSHMMEKKSLEELISLSPSTSEDVLFRLIHLLMIYREFFIGSKSQSKNFAAQVDRLGKLLVNLSKQNAFERLGLKESCSDQDIKKAYTELATTLHPDKLKNATPELMQLSAQVFDKIQEAYSHLKTNEKRLEYVNQLEARKLESAAKVSRHLDVAFNQLVQGNISGAEEELKAANGLSPTSSPRAKLLQTWMELKSNKLPGQEAMRIILALPNEEKDTALYLHTRGLAHLAMNEVDKALTSFKNAVSKDTNFVASRRELSLLTKDDKKQNVNILNADLRDVVGLFFKKNKKK